MDFSNAEAPPDNSRDTQGPMEEISLDEARRLLTFLAESTDSLRHTNDAGSLPDETYRAAHSLKGELDQAGIPGVVRIARLVQDVVRAVRAGRIPPRADALQDRIDRDRVESADVRGLHARKGTPLPVLDPRPHLGMDSLLRETASQGTAVVVWLDGAHVAFLVESVTGPVADSGAGRHALDPGSLIGRSAAPPAADPWADLRAALWKHAAYTVSDVNMCRQPREMKVSGPVCAPSCRARPSVILPFGTIAAAAVMMPSLLQASLHRRPRLKVKIWGAFEPVPESFDMIVCRDRLSYLDARARLTSSRHSNARSAPGEPLS